MVGGGAGGGYTGIDEANDGSLTPVEGLPQFDGLEPPAGTGGIAMERSSDAFFLDTPHQSNRLELAYLVARSEEAGIGGFAIRLGVFGAGITGSGQPGGAQWGGSENPEPLAVSFFTGEDRDPDRILLAARGGVEVWSVPQPSPGPGFVATRIELRASYPAAKLVTIEALHIDGSLIQIWLPTKPDTLISTPKAPWPTSYPGEWAPYDSRILIKPSMVGGGAGAGYDGIDESNDRSLKPIQELPPFLGKTAPAGLGDISMEQGTDAFFLDTRFQSERVELAYLVARSRDAAAGDFKMNLGVLGSGVTNSGLPGGAQWGGHENPEALPISFFPESWDPAHILLARRGSLEVWSLPQPAPGPGFVASRLELRTSDPAASIVTIEGLTLSGPFVQVWLPRLLGSPLPTPKAPWPSKYPAEWAPFDSRVVIEASMVGGGAGAGYAGIGESNDSSIGKMKGLPRFQDLDPITGLGTISMASSSDAFFLDTPYQANRVGLAYLVARTADATRGEFAMTLGVLGAGIRNSGTTGGAQWGGTENPGPLDVAFTPRAPRSPLLSIRRAVGGVDVSFTAMPGHRFSLQYSRAMSAWRTISMDLAGEVRFEDRNSTRMARSNGFYRIVEQ
jgi:hypothetical protein